jgi:excinuclease ABC subunit B
MTESMEKAISKTLRRREIQLAHNEKHGITPTPIIKKSSNAILAFLDVSRRLNAQELDQVYEHAEDVPLENIPELIQQLEAQMKDAAKKMEFENAAKYRDRIKHLRDKMTGRH